MVVGGAVVVEGGLKVSKRSKTEGDMEEKLDENKVRIYGLTRVLSKQQSRVWNTILRLLLLC